MAQVIRFFPQQALVGSPSGSGTATFYSEIFEVAGYEKLQLQACLMTMSRSGGTPVAQVTADLETTSDSRFASGTWLDTSGTALTLSTLPQASGGVFSGLLQYVRAKVTVSEDTSCMLMVEGVAKEVT